MILSFNKYFNKGFTLAEILLTLTIIGVVVSAVIPELIQDTKKAEYIVKLKKEYAVLQQAFKMLELEEGGSILNNPNIINSNTAVDSLMYDSPKLMNDFTNKLNISKNCGNGTGCVYNTPIKYLGGSYLQAAPDSGWSGRFGKVITSSGAIMILAAFNSCGWSISAGIPANSRLYQSVCGQILVDINGNQGPNQLGRDLFYFHIAKTGIYPMGMDNDGKTCDIASSSEATSAGCAAKVLREGSIDY